MIFLSLRDLAIWMKTKPIFRLPRKKNFGTWNEECEEAFNKIKHYLQSPPLLVPPESGRPLILYLTVTETTMRCVLGQHDEIGKKKGYLLPK
jgi:hypothetical protein